MKMTSRTYRKAVEEHYELTSDEIETLDGMSDETVENIYGAPVLGVPCRTLFQADTEEAERQMIDILKGLDISLLMLANQIGGRLRRPEERLITSPEKRQDTISDALGVLLYGGNPEGNLFIVEKMAQIRGIWGDVLIYEALIISRCTTLLIERSAAKAWIPLEDF